MNEHFSLPPCGEHRRDDLGSRLGKLADQFDLLLYIGGDNRFREQTPRRRIIRSGRCRQKNRNGDEGKAKPPIA